MSRLDIDNIYKALSAEINRVRLLESQGAPATTTLPLISDLLVKVMEKGYDRQTAQYILEYIFIDLGLVPASSSPLSSVFSSVRKRFTGWVDSAMRPVFATWQARTKLATAIIIILILWLAHSQFYWFLRKAISYSLADKLKPHDRDADHRAEFRKMNLVRPIEDLSKPHPTLNANRNAANYTLTNFARDVLHREVVACPRMHKDSPLMPNANVQLRKSVRNDLYLAQENTVDPTDAQFIKIVDLDNQMDMHQVLRGSDIGLYSFNPKIAAYTGDEYAFTINNDTFHLIVQGGLEIDGVLWDYSKEIVSSRTGYWDETARNLYGVNTWPGWLAYNIAKPFMRVVDYVTGLEVVWLYDVDVRPSAYSIDWDLIYLQHKATLVVANGEYLDENLSTRSFGGVSTAIAHNKSISIALAGSAAQATFPIHVYDNALAKFNLDPKIPMSSIERLLIGDGPEGSDTARDAVILITHLRQGNAVPSPMTTDPVTYSFPRPLRTEEPKSSMRIALKPYTNITFAPAAGYNSDHYTVYGRISSIKNSTKHVPDRYWTYVDEFNALLVPQVHVGIPFEEVEVLERQNRPTQRALYEQWKHVLKWTGNKIASFMKREAYAKVTDPRNISTVAQGQKIIYSQYTYPFMEQVMKRAHWYAFGYSPRDLAQRVSDLARKTKFVSDADLSRQDGRKGEFHQLAFKMAMMRYFSPRYHKELNKAIDSEFHAKARTRHGIKYSVGSSQLSGSPSTSISNTHNNALEKFIAYREQGYSCVGAWNVLGLYGGDDSLDLDKLDHETLKGVCEATGNVVKIATRKSGEIVPFLGRLFYDPWCTSVMMADVKRQFCKLGLTTAPPEITAAQAMRRKATSLLVSDPNTPVLSNWARAVMRTTMNSLPLPENLDWNDDSYLVQLFPNHESWPQDEIDREMAIKCVATNLEVDSNYVAELCVHFDSVNEFEQLDCGEILEYPFDLGYTVEIGGELVYKEGATTVPPKIDLIPAVESRNARRRRLARERAKLAGGGGHRPEEKKFSSKK